MTEKEVRAHLKSAIKSQYGSTKGYAHTRGCTIFIIYSAIQHLYPWILKEFGVTKRIAVKYSLK